MPANYTSDPPSFFTWHYTDGLNRILRIWGNYLEFFYHYFSIAHLFGTLFAPYKRIYKLKTRPGFSFEEFVDRVGFNIISRVIGVVMRSFVITAGLFCLVVGSLLGAAIATIWILCPFLTYPLYRLATKSTRIMYRLSFGPSFQEEMGKIFASDWGVFFLARVGLTRDNIIANSLQDAGAHAASDPLYFRDPSEAMFAILYRSQSLARYLFIFGITREDIVFVSNWFKDLKRSSYMRRAFWKRDNLLHIPSLGKSWTYGYTPVLDRYTVDMSTLPIPFSQFIGRNKEISDIERLLTKKTHANVFLVGEAGVGKRPLLIYFAHKVFEGRVLPELENKRILLLNLEELFTREVDVIQRKTTLSAMLAEADRAGNIVLVIDEFDRFVASGPDRIDVSDVFTHTLSRDHLRVIAVLRPGAYHQYLAPNKGLSQYFGLVELRSLTREETMLVASSIIPAFEDSDRFFTYEALREIVTDADRYIKEDPFPEKVINLIDQIASDAKSHRVKGPIGAAQVKQYIGNIIHVPLAVSEDDRSRLIHLEELLHRRVVGQDEAISQVSGAMRRARTNVGSRKDKPVGTFLFMGPTGVGKTETAKAIAEAYFGSEETLLRFDMSEFQDVSAIRQFLGDFVSGKVGVFARKIHENPFAVLLLDELEKASVDVRNIFLTALDEGFVTDAFGKKLYLNNMIVIATSNAGAEYIRERVATGVDSASLQKDVVEYVQKERIYSPEFLNRFDGVIVFQPITHDQTREIADIAIATMITRIRNEQGITLNVTLQTKNLIVEKGFDTALGGRALNRAIQQYIEDPLAQKILAGSAIRGSTVEI